MGSLNLTMRSDVQQWLCVELSASDGRQVLFGDWSSGLGSISNEQPIHFLTSPDTSVKQVLFSNLREHLLSIQTRHRAQFVGDAASFTNSGLSRRDFQRRLILSLFTEDGRSCNFKPRTWLTRECAPQAGWRRDGTGGKDRNPRPRDGVRGHGMRGLRMGRLGLDRSSPFSEEDSCRRYLHPRLQVRDDDNHRLGEGRNSSRFLVYPRHVCLASRACRSTHTQIIRNGTKARRSE
ncbi:hypothetical protein B0J13DRAFT_253517 [Dactylonectria estremocensis]|uniref:Uncharacterized protein n=1 Tax=Dactylonectria estremocensis TaxID=1079267 RepID=A0A9P9JCD6_9HYPO|nr:hypothetical protein B0J13DRAFT_253517 [Dactylonectria estremocensis]